MTPKSKIKATKAWAWVYDSGKPHCACPCRACVEERVKKWGLVGGSIQRVLITAAKAKGGR